MWRQAPNFVLYDTVFPSCEAKPFMRTHGVSALITAASLAGKLHLLCLLLTPPLISLPSSGTWSLCWALGCRVLVRATRLSAGSSTACRFTCSPLSSDRCSGTLDTRANTTTVCFYRQPMLVSNVDNFWVCQSCCFSLFILVLNVSFLFLYLFIYPYFVIIFSPGLLLCVRWCLPAEWATCDRHVSVLGGCGAEWSKAASSSGHSWGGICFTALTFQKIKSLVFLFFLIMYVFCWLT